MFIFLFMSDLFITNTKDRPCISPPYVTPPPLYKPIKNPLRKYISPGLIVGGLRFSEKRWALNNWGEYSHLKNTALMVCRHKAREEINRGFTAGTVESPASDTLECLLHKHRSLHILSEYPHL
jgi:hypothetical protein